MCHQPWPWPHSNGLYGVPAPEQYGPWKVGGLCNTRRGAYYLESSHSNIRTYIITYIPFFQEDLRRPLLQEGIQGRSQERRIRLVRHQRPAPLRAPRRAAILCRENARMFGSTLDDARSRARATHRSARPRSPVADSAADP